MATTEWCSPEELAALKSLFASHGGDEAALAFCEKISKVGADRMDGMQEGVNTFFLTSCGALVFIMHAGFAMVS